MIRVIVSVAALLCLLGTSVSLAAAPSDISGISKLSKVYTRGIQDPSKAWVEDAASAGLKHRLKRLKSLAKTHGYSDLLLLDPDDLEKKLVARVRQQAKTVRDTDSLRKRGKLVHELLVLSTEDSGLEAVLADYLGFPAVGKLVEVELPRAQINFSKYAKVSSETERLKLIKDSTTLGAERGGSGVGNGIPDAGEWIKVSMAVKNVSDKPYFSSSAWVSTSSECAWAPKAQEFEFPELPPGGDDVGALSVWVYLSRTCPDGESVSLRVNVKDTHRTRGEGHILSVEIPVQNRLRHRAGSLRFDRDIPGYSDGSQAKITDAGQSFELSHDMRYTSSRFRKAHMGWDIDSDGDALIEEQSFRSEAPMLRGGGDSDRLLPGDDLDILTVDRRKFDQKIEELATSKRWATASDAHIIFATDVLLAYSDPQPPPKVKAKPKTESSCTDGEDNDDDGDIDCADSECAKKKVCKVLKPADVSAVMSLVKKTTRIEAQRTASIGGDAIDAVNDHYELSFDSDRFAKHYKCLVDEVPLEKCGVKKCPDCKKEPKSESGLGSLLDGLTSDKPPETRYVQYVKRTYFRVPVKWTPPDACTGVTCESPSAPRCSGNRLLLEKAPGRCVSGGCSYKKKTIDCADSGKRCVSGRCIAEAVVKPEEPPELVVPLPDMGARLDIAYHSATLGVPDVVISGKPLWDTDSASVGEFELRYSHGLPGLTYFGGLAFGSAEIDSLGDPAALSTFSLSAGAGYLMRLGNRFEFHPRAGLALLYRGLEIDEDPWTADGSLADANMDVGAMAVGFELGAGLRARITAALAVHVDIAYMLQGAGPAWTTPGGDEMTLLSGSHPRVGGGLTWMW
jgi:hypothetical protein